MLNTSQEVEDEDDSDEDSDDAPDLDDGERGVRAIAMPAAAAQGNSCSVAESSTADRVLDDPVGDAAAAGAGA